VTAEKYIFIGLGGAIGSVLRYAAAHWLYRSIGDGFPYGTLAVNVVGCFFIGLLMALLEDRFLVQPNLRLFVTVGILGGFTTFSTFSFETIALVRSGDMFLAATNVVLSVLLCLSGTWSGVLLGKYYAL
jgi:fluoride exporter